MSQHIFEQKSTIDGDTYRVQMGWDKPLQRFYCVMWVLPEVDEAIYSNVYDSTPNQTLWYLEKQVIEYGLTIPDGMLLEIIQDERDNVVNKTKHWG